MISFREWLNEREGVETEYHKFFRKKLEKFGVKSPSELSAEDKKKFFDEIDAEWEGEKEEHEVDEKKVCNESSDKVLEELLKEVNSLYNKFDKAEQKIKIFSQSKLTEVKVKIMDALEK